jgi:hypothetical protein
MYSAVRFKGVLLDEGLAAGAGERPLFCVGAVMAL